MAELNFEQRQLNWNVKESISYFSKIAAEAAYMMNIMGKEWFGKISQHKIYDNHVTFLSNKRANCWLSPI